MNPPNYQVSSNPSIIAAPTRERSAPNSLASSGSSALAYSGSFSDISLYRSACDYHPQPHMLSPVFESLPRASIAPFAALDLRDPALNASSRHRTAIPVAASSVLPRSHSWTNLELSHADYLKSSGQFDRFLPPAFISPLEASAGASVARSSGVPSNRISWASNRKFLPLTGSGSISLSNRPLSPSADSTGPGIESPRYRQQSTESLQRSPSDSVSSADSVSRSRSSFLHSEFITNSQILSGKMPRRHSLTDAELLATDFHPPSKSALAQFAKSASAVASSPSPRSSPSPIQTPALTRSTSQNTNLTANVAAAVMATANASVASAPGAALPLLTRTPNSSNNAFAMPAVDVARSRDSSLSSNSNSTGRKLSSPTVPAPLSPSHSHPSAHSHSSAPAAVVAPLAVSASAAVSSLSHSSSPNRQTHFTSDPGDQSGWLSSADHRVVKIWVGSWNMGSKDIADPGQIEKFVPLGYDLIVIGVQECVQNTIFDAIENYLKPHKMRRLPVQAAVAGRGDGAFIRQKFTGIACFLSSHLRAHVHVLKQAGCSLGMTEGSKGGAAFALKVFDRTIAFVSVHMSSRTVADRRASYTSLVEMVGAAIGDESFQLLEQFHHLVWFGDLNYRIGLQANVAIDFLNHQNLKGLLHYEELSQEARSHGAFIRFHEAPILFFPTYKKKINRPLHIQREGNVHWPTDVYNIHHKQPWYKSGNIVERVPSFCDRILFHSLPVFDSEFRPEWINSRDARSGQEIKIPNYTAHENILTTSDHTAVSCGFLLRVKPVKRAEFSAAFSQTLRFDNRSISKNSDATAQTASPLDSIGGSAFRSAAGSISISRSSNSRAPQAAGAIGMASPGSIKAARAQQNQEKGHHSMTLSPQQVRDIVKLAAAPAGSPIAQVSQVPQPALAAAAGVVSSSAASLMATAAPTASPPHSLMSQSTSSRMYTVRLQSIRLLSCDPGLELKFIRVLFPAPFEVNANLLPISKVIQVNPLSQLPANSILASGHPNAINHEVVGTMAHSNSANNGAGGPVRTLAHAYLPVSSPYLGEFSVYCPGDPRDLDSTPNPEFFHFLCKFHFAEGYTAQCAFALSQRIFSETPGHETGGEFEELLTRNGLFLMDSKGNHIRAIVSLEGTKSSS